MDEEPRTIDGQRKTSNGKQNKRHAGSTFLVKCCLINNFPIWLKLNSCCQQSGFTKKVIISLTAKKSREIIYFSAFFIFFLKWLSKLFLQWNWQLSHIFPSIGLVFHFRQNYRSPPPFLPE